MKLDGAELQKGSLFANIPIAGYVLVNFTDYPADQGFETEYHFRKTDKEIYLPDYLPYSICKIDKPILFLCNDIHQIKENDSYLLHRRKRRDIIMDLEGTINYPSYKYKQKGLPYE